jgi:hypothetical protein
MTFVQGSHRGHETDGPVVVELFAPPLAETGDLAEHFDGCVGYDLVFLSEI